VSLEVGQVVVVVGQFVHLGSNALVDGRDLLVL
jgi:hypothetical protein